MVSINGGYEPRWRADGREIYYLSEDRKLMAVSVGPGPSFGVPLRIPTKKIAHSELKTIRAPPSDAGKSIVRQVIVMSQEKGWGYRQHHFVSVAVDGSAGAKFA